MDMSLTKVERRRQYHWLCSQPKEVKETQSVLRIKATGPVLHVQSSAKSVPSINI